MCASSGTKFSSMNEAISSSLYDSASSRAQPPHEGAALKSIISGFFRSFASASAASASVLQFTFIAHLHRRTLQPRLGKVFSSSFLNSGFCMPGRSKPALAIKRTEVACKLRVRFCKLRRPEWVKQPNVTSVRETQSCRCGHSPIKHSHVPRVPHSSRATACGC